MKKNLLFFTLLLIGALAMGACGIQDAEPAAERDFYFEISHEAVVQMDEMLAEEGAGTGTDKIFWIEPVRG